MKKVVKNYKGQSYLNLSADLGGNSIFSSGTNSIRNDIDTKQFTENMERYGLKNAASNLNRKNQARKMSSLIGYNNHHSEMTKQKRLRSNVNYLH